MPICRGSRWQRATRSICDTASKGGPDIDWSFCSMWIATRAKLLNLVDVWPQRVDYPALKAAVMRLTKGWNAQRELVEDTGAGISLVQELKGSVSGIIAVRPDGDKTSRMTVASAKFEAGQALLPKRASWLPDCLHRRNRGLHQSGAQRRATPTWATVARNHSPWPF